MNVTVRSIALLTRLFRVVLFGLAAFPSTGFAQGRAPDLGQMSIEDLMNIKITSASRKEERAIDVAAAVFVITSDDIRLSGMATIPDLLRLAPGVQVAQINSNKWAVSVRGFNGLYANKLLVLVDGRSVYHRIFAGVFWDAEDLLFDDIDRIEVIRGPGSALWGANAVNGVINIVTKSAANTQGALVRVDGGSSGEQAAIRYGGAVGEARYRLYAQWTGRDQSLIAPDTAANDRSHSVTTGFRADWTNRRGALMLEGDVTAGQTRALWPNLNPETANTQPIADDPSDSQGGHLLARWTQARSGGGSLQIQSFMDIGARDEPVGHYRGKTFDFDTQYHTALGARHDLVIGAGYRFDAATFAGRVGFSLTPSDDRSSLFNAFVRDDIALVGNRLVLTFGGQVQHDSQSGVGAQPTARLIWKALPDQTVWAATSRALRTPSLYERGIQVDQVPVPSAAGLPLVVRGIGNPDAETETLVETEAGYRLESGTAWSIDVTGFVGRYGHLRTSEVAAPVVQFVPSPRILVTSQFGNQLAAATHGLEVVGRWAPIRAWRFDGSYSFFHLTPRLAAASQDPLAAGEDGSAPGRQWQLRSVFSPGTRATVNFALFHVGPLERLHVAAYTRADVSAEWRFSNRLSAMVTGQNLFDAAHAEFGGVGSFLLVTQVPRSAGVRLRWTFR